MRYTRHTMRYRILTLVLPVVILVLCLLAYHNYATMRDSLLESYEASRQSVESHIVDAVTLIDAAYRMLEVRLEEELRVPLTAFLEAYEASGGQLSQRELEALKVRFGNNYDFFIVDSRTVVTVSTEPLAQDFSFAAFDVALGNKINQIRAGDEIWFEQLRTNVTTGRLSKFAYAPVSDKKVLLEISYSVGGFNQLIEELKPQSFTEDLVRISPLVESIRIFDSYGYQIVDSGENYEPTADSRALVARAVQEKAFEVQVDDRTVRKYIHLALNAKRERTLANTDRIVEITYNTAPIEAQLQSLAASSLVVSLLVLVLLGITVTGLVRRLTRPIEALRLAAEEISQGNYGIRAAVESRDEVGDLAESFNKMLDEIHRNFGEIELQKQALEESNRTLEEKVAERTRELAERNLQLDSQRLLLEQIALQDGLTGIPNRRSFTERFAYEWERSIRDQRPLSLMILDVDAFKLYNDCYGHVMGDTALKAVAGTLSGALQRSTDFTGRIGGEEFAVLLPETDAEGARQLAEEMRRRVEALDLPHEHTLAGRLTVSIGGATAVPEAGACQQQFFELADKMLYQAKAAGKNAVRWQTP